VFRGCLGGVWSAGAKVFGVQGPLGWPFIGREGVAWCVVRQAINQQTRAPEWPLCKHKQQPVQ
jgi:hypothetical protein